MRRLTLPASENVYISEYYPDQNFSDKQNEALYIGRFAKPRDSYRSLLRFNIDAIKRMLPSRTKVRSAYLRLYIYRNEIPSGYIQAGIYLLRSVWYDSQVSWNNQVVVMDQAQQTFIIPYQWQGPIFIDLTQTVQGWYEGSIQNYGLVIKGEEDHNCLVGFRSANYYEKNTHSCITMLFGDE